MKLTPRSLEVLEVYGLQRYAGAKLEEAPKSYREALEKWDGREGLLFIGPVGVGKTSAMVLAARMVYDAYGWPFWFSWGDFSLVDFRDFAELLERATRAEAVFLDDVGVALAGEGALYMAERFVSRLYDAGKTLVATANITPAEFKAAVEGKHGPAMQRVFDRLREMCRVIAYTGKSRRGRNE